MLFWKLFAALDVLVNLAYWRAVVRGDQKLDRKDAITLPIGLTGTFGLITYAFSLQTQPMLFWRFFLPVLIMSSAWEIASAASEDEFGVGPLIGVALAFLLVGFTSIAIYRLGGSAWIGVFGI